MDAPKKNVTIDDLAVMVAGGFEGVNKRLDKVEGRLGIVEGKLEKVEDRLSTVEGRLGSLETSMEGLRSSVNNYLELSDKRYLELKARQNILANWVKEIGEKTGVKVDLEDLEKVS